MENKELQLILASAPLHPSEVELHAIDALIPAIEDWNKLALLLIDRGTAPLLYRKLSQEPRTKNQDNRQENTVKTLENIDLVPVAFITKLRNAYYKTLSRNTLIYQEFGLLSEILRANSIPFITLKGICMAEWLYTDIGLRQMSDIDILIQEKDGVRCLDALHAAGYVSQQEFNVNEFVDSKSQNHYNPLFRNDVMVEIHIRLQNTREIYQQNLQEVWRDAVPVETWHATSKTQTEHAPSLRGTLRLELSDMLIHACLHLDKHFVTTHVQFTSFNDIVNLLRMIDSGQRTKSKEQRIKTEEFGQKNQELRIKTEEIEDFWERFEAKCKQYNFADTVFRYLVMVRHYYGAPLPDYLYDKYSPLTPEGGKDFIRFENFLAGTGNEFIGRGAPRSNTEAHIRHLKQMKNPVDILRSRTDGMSTSLPYVKGVVFPGKEFMVQKYSIKNSSIYFLYYPYRWWIGIKGMVVETWHAASRKV